MQVKTVNEQEVGQEASMTEENEEKTAAAAQRTIECTVRNLGEPLRFTNVAPFGWFTDHAAEEGQQVRVWIKLGLTSDEPLFHKLAKNLANIVNHMARQSGTTVSLCQANTVLIILKPDATAELWLDTAAVTIQCLTKRALTALTPIGDSDIADVTKMNFPDVTFGTADKVLCLFREGWRFGFAFDMNPEGELDIEAFTTVLGTLCRELRYKEIYDAIRWEAGFERLLTSGWFPFAEVITTEYLDLLEFGLDFAKTEDRILAKFDDERLQTIFQRWIAKPHFAARKALLSEAISSFRDRRPGAVIKIILTEIEGVLRDAYIAAHDGQRGNREQWIDYAQKSAEFKSGGTDTLLLPEMFCRHLREHTYASFKNTGTASSRHAVSHGAAADDSYTMTRALQAVLTFDQLAFYT